MGEVKLCKRADQAKLCERADIGFSVISDKRSRRDETGLGEGPEKTRACLLFGESSFSESGEEKMENGNCK
jgi:hypothetical protein